MTVVPVLEITSEAARIEAWRLKQLLDAGYPVPLAERLAYNQHVDLHLAVELVTDRGCAPELAADILV